VVIPRIPTLVISTVDRAFAAGSVAVMSLSTRDRVSAIGTAALLLLGAGIWLVGDPTAGPDGDMHMLAPAMLIVAALLAASAWLLRGKYGRSAGLSSELTLALVAPLALTPASAFASPVAFAIAAVAWPLSIAPLALLLADAADPTRRVPRNRRLALTAIAAAIAMTPLLFLGQAPPTWVVVVREALVASALLVPVASAATLHLSTIGAWASSTAEDGGPIRLAGAALAPLAVRLLTTVPVEGAAALVSLFAVAALGFLLRFGVVPLARAASTALRQRDQVAAASDAERRRLAADLHDGPLQSLTLLAYRLEVAGDAENAELARDVTTELRAITASLRLPIVDDLGTGPALEWLTERVGRLAGTPIDLEHRQDGRPPREVEHAIFRVAQEALANAARHGRPPIQVRYEADAAHASLVVQDAGDGAMVQARNGRGLGIVGMRERAHAIGADIELAQSGAGMKVSLVWPGTAS
jgi:signal transduction histidine kinase